MSARIKRNLALGVLAGKPVQGQVEGLVRQGLVTLDAVLSGNTAAVQSATTARGKRSWFLRHRLRQGAVLELCLRPRMDLIGLLVLKSRRRVSFPRGAEDRDKLVAMLIERARQKALELTEEGTRWLV